MSESTKDMQGEVTKSTADHPGETAMGVAARLWCESETEHINMEPALAMAFARKVRGYHDLIESAWGIIANAGWGNWEKESVEWREAATRWREKYHAMLDEDLIAVLAVHAVEDRGYEATVPLERQAPREVREGPCPHCGHSGLTAQPNGEIWCRECYGRVWSPETTT